MSDSLTAEERTLITELLACRLGLDFEDYRLHVLDGAVQKRMSAREIGTPKEYSGFLADDEGEFSMFVDLVTNTLSRFYRNRAQIEALREFLVPELTGNGNRDRSLNVWIAGCATGEEPYSVAMALAESLNGGPRARITATDISRGALETARRGEYPEDKVRAVPGDLIPRYFVKTENGWQISDDLRERVDFKEHNVASGPAVRDADLVLCRNVLIYLTPPARDRALDSLAESLTDGGFLLIGNSETLPRDPRFYGVMTRWGRLYRRSCREEA